MAPEPTKSISLPSLVIGPIDIGRLLRELQAINEALLALKLRGAGAAPKLPKTTLLMDRVVELNKLNLLHETDRQHLQQSLETIKRGAPLLHISFGTDPSSAFLDKLMSWLRREIHPLLLVTIGLQPNIGAGCVIRGANHYFDFSLRQQFAGQRKLLMSALAPAPLKVVKPQEVKT